MVKIEFNNMIADDNELWITLTNYSANISINENTKGLYYQLKILENDEGKIRFYFDSFEDAVTFTKIIEDYNNLEDIVMAYEKHYKREEFDNKQKTTKGTMISISNEMVDALIAKYYGSGKDYLVTAKHTEEINDNNQLEVQFFVMEYINYGKFRQTNSIPLTDDNLRYIFNDYLKTTGYELIDFELDIGRNGFQKVRLYTREKAKKYALRPNER